MRLQKLLGTFLVAAVIFAGCSNDSDKHKHSWSTEYSSDATTHWIKCSGCAEIRGKDAHSSVSALAYNEIKHWEVCDECGGKYEINPHSFNGWSEVTPATEEAEGSENRVCNDCGYEETRAIPQLNHTHKFAAEWTAGETTHWHAATCDHDEKSEETAHSTTVELSKDQTNHWKVCDVCEGIFEVTEHNFGQWSEVNPATEEAEGLEKRVCNDCRYEETRAIPQLNHTHKFATEWTAGETTHWHAATCGHNEKSGEAAHSTTAELSKDQINHWKICDVCGGRYEVTAHIEDTGTVTTGSTCTKKGVRTYKCTVCEEVLKTEEISEKGHLNITGLSKDETNHWKVCDVCGGKYEITAHTEDEGTVTTVPTCVTKGVRTYKCTVCEEVLRTEEVAALGHTDDTGTITIDPTCVTKGVRTYICTVCEEVFRTEEIPELYSTPVDAETGLAATSSSTYIYFGVFPKTVHAKTSDVKIDEADSVKMGANTYYKGSDENWYVRKFADTIYNYPGKYSDESEITGEFRYFKVEPVKWRVLTTNYNNTNKALLLAEDILMSNVPYYVINNNRTISGNTVYPNNYKYSTIRAYLNGKYESDDTQKKTAYTDEGFLQTAFTSAAQLLIAETEVDNTKETTDNAATYTCENTTDKIFLLSYSELRNRDYGFRRNNSTIDYLLKRVTTDYAKANHGKHVEITGDGCFWITRSPSKFDYYYVQGVAGGCHLQTYTEVASKTSGIVPALCISLE